MPSDFNFSFVLGSWLCRSSQADLMLCSLPLMQAGPFVLSLINEKECFCCCFSLGTSHCNVLRFRFKAKQIFCIAKNRRLLYFANESFRKCASSSPPFPSLIERPYLRSSASASSSSCFYRLRSCEVTTGQTFSYPLISLPDHFRSFNILS